jgi:hypothetical protein
MKSLYFSRYRWYRGYNNDPSYTSHSHGWSAGPTSALTFYLLGMTLDAPQGKEWALQPRIGGGIPSAQGGFQTALGWFGVNWTIVETSGGNVTELSINVDTPTGTSGVVTLPPGVVVDEANGVVKVNGASIHFAGDTPVFTLQGGQHLIQALVRKV